MNSVNTKCSSIFLKFEAVNIEGSFKSDSSNNIIVTKDESLQCNGCGSKVGSWSWIGVRCGCGIWVEPNIQLHRRKIDVLLEDISSNENNISSSVLLCKMCREYICPLSFINVHSTIDHTTEEEKKELVDDDDDDDCNVLSLSLLKIENEKKENTKKNKNKKDDIRMKEPVHTSIEYNSELFYVRNKGSEHSKNASKKTHEKHFKGIKCKSTNQKNKKKRAERHGFSFSPLKVDAHASLSTTNTNKFPIIIEKKERIKSSKKERKEKRCAKQAEKIKEDNKRREKEIERQKILHKRHIERKEQQKRKKELLEKKRKEKKQYEIEEQLMIEVLGI